MAEFGAVRALTQKPPSFSVFFCLATGMNQVVHVTKVCFHERPGAAAIKVGRFQLLRGMRLAATCQGSIVCCYERFSTAAIQFERFRLLRGMRLANGMSRKHPLMS